MTVCPHLRALLAEEYVSYRLVPPLGSGGAQPVAKVVVLRDAGGEFLMVVVPAPSRVDLGALSRATGRSGLCLATEREIGGLFPDCEGGAMPPFGHLYGVPVYLDACFRDEPDIVFPGGTHQALVGMSMADFRGLARPVTGRWCFHQGALKAA